MSNFSKDLAAFSKIRSLFPKTQCCCQKATPTLLLQGYFIIFSFPLTGCHFQTMLQTSSKWLIGIKICSRVSCRFLLGTALSTHYGLHTRKEGADSKGVTLRGFAPFLGHFSDLMKLHELKNFYSTKYLDVSSTMPSGIELCSKDEKNISRKRTSEWEKSCSPVSVNKLIHYLAS